MRDRTGRSRRLLLCLLLASVGYLYLRSARGDALGVEAWLQRVVEVPMTRLAGAAWSFRQRASDWIFRERLGRRVHELETRVAELEVRNAELAERVNESARLGQLLGLSERLEARVRAARVIAAEGSGELRSLVLDAGMVAGVGPDAPVVSADGLVGRVVQRGDLSSVVQLVTDVASGVAVYDERSRVQGVLVGDGERGCRMKYVPNLDDVQIGDRILASGLDGIYPRGVLAGVVESVESGEDSFRTIVVRPATAINRLETVLVYVGGGEEGRAGRSELASALPRSASRGRRR